MKFFLQMADKSDFQYYKTGSVSTVHLHNKNNVSKSAIKTSFTQANRKQKNNH